MKKMWSMLFILVLVMSSLVACNTKEEAKKDVKKAEASTKYPLTIKHLKGETVIEQAPKRIAAGDFIVLEHLFALGKAPIASGHLKTAQGFPIYKEYFKKHKDIIALSDDYSTPLNYEKLLEAAPDLIIAYDWANIDYEKASKIAPTIVIDSKINGGYTDAKDAFSEGLKLIAEASDAQDAYKSFMNRFNEQIAATKKSIEEKGLSGQSTMFVMAGAKTNVVYDINFYFEKLGLAPVKAMHNNAKAAAGIDLEALVKANPSILFLAEDYTNRTGAVEKMMNNEAFKQIDAAKNNQVYIIDTAAFGPTAVGKMYGVEWIGKSVSK